jgi:hypothetical protein
LHADAQRYTVICHEPDNPGKRVSTLAESLEEASDKLDAEYGKGNVFYLHNEEDARRPR